MAWWVRELPGSVVVDFRVLLYLALSAKAVTKGSVEKA